jgi:hypothetical protein
LIHRPGTTRPVSPLERAASTGDERPWTSLASNPLHNSVGPALVPQLKAHLAQHLPDFLMPSAIVVLDGLPLTRSGKIDRQALSAIQPARGHSSAAPPADEAESAVEQIWRELLQTGPLDRHINFFDAGGHSLLLVQVLHRVNARFGSTLALIDLFRATTIAALAQLARGSGAERTPPKAAHSANRRAERRSAALATRRSMR